MDYKVSISLVSQGLNITVSGKNWDLTQEYQSAMNIYRLSVES